MTHIARAALKFYRAHRNVSGDWLAHEVFLSERTLRRAGPEQFHYFRSRIGLVASKLVLSRKEILSLYSAALADELFGSLVAAGEENDPCFPFLQSLWFHPEVRPWFKVVFFGDRCLGSHPDFVDVPDLPRELVDHLNATLESLHRGGSSKTRKDIGTARDKPARVLASAVASNKAVKRIDTAIYAAYLEAVKDGSSTAISELAEMSLIFARIARRCPEHCDAMIKALRDLRGKAEALSPVAEWQLGRALYMLGEDGALCAYVRDGKRCDEAANLFYLQQQAGDDGSGVKTLSQLCEHIEFARVKASIPLVALYARMTVQLIEAKARGKKWSSALSDLEATEKMAAMIGRLLDRSRDQNSLRKRLWKHNECAACRDVAISSLAEIGDKIAEFRAAVAEDLKS